jgi:hypothetical protein
MIRAVLAGLAADIGGSIVAGVYAVAFASLLPRILAVVAHRPREPWGQHGSGILDAAFSLVVGAAFSLLGGFVAGSLHRPAPLRAALYLGIATCLFGLLFSVTVGQLARHGGVHAAAEYIAAFTAALAGGVLAKRSLSRGAA